jgi:hypothetical protein
MALFKPRGEPVPAWSPFAEADDWRAFAAAVRGEARVALKARLVDDDFFTAGVNFAPSGEFLAMMERRV